MADDSAPNGAPQGRKATWKQNPEAVRADILRVARAEFAEHGLSGARIQEIAARTATSKRMIFYYFGDKTRLYRAVLEDAYVEVRAAEAALDLDGLAADRALARLVGFTFDHHRDNPDFVRLVMIENIHRAAHLGASDTIRATNSPVIGQLRRICERGGQEGLFRADLDPLQLHWTISALCFYNVSNQPSFSSLFGDDLSRPEGQERLRAGVIDTVLRAVLCDPGRAAALV